MAVLARADSGWKSWRTWSPRPRAARRSSGQLGQPSAAGAEIVAKHFGIDVNHLRGKGGKSAINALVARDANVGWGGGVQRGLVAAGELVILASAEDAPLVQAPGGKTLKGYGIDLSLGFQFLLAGPKGKSTEAADAIAKAIAEVLSNPESKTAKFVSKQYPPGPVVLAGDELTARLEEELRGEQAASRDVAK